MKGMRFMRSSTSLLCWLAGRIVQSVWVAHIFANLRGRVVLEGARPFEPTVNDGYCLAGRPKSLQHCGSITPARLGWTPCEKKIKFSTAVQIPHSH